MMMMVPAKSPNNTLHAILTHKVEVIECEESVEVEGRDSTDTSDPKEEHIFEDADISPRVEKAIISSRKARSRGLERLHNISEFNQRDRQRLDLWEELYSLANGMDLPWIRQQMNYVQLGNQGDKPLRTTSSTEKFSVKSAWELLRTNDSIKEDLINLWVKGLPLKISFLAWRIWKGRNTILHGGTYSVGKIILNINDTILKFIKGKCNTNGAFRGNPGPSSATFCIRDHLGNFIVAKGVRILDTTNLVAEAKAMRETLVFCKENGITQIILESDSNAMIKILEGRSDTP
ncbi:hypothetical protein HAX54_027774 [Datura stramonium]|uniref:RNase H type-1 domain-containing protein n=1 Tax=Datura stramonium TaxID=4076 RepID=A0ABS8S922_DATST|nr:hypothetical protein [Datura stramonium]